MNLPQQKQRAGQVIEQFWPVFVAGFQAWVAQGKLLILPPLFGEDGGAEDGQEIDAPADLSFKPRPLHTSWLEVAVALNVAAQFPAKFIIHNVRMDHYRTPDDKDGFDLVVEIKNAGKIYRAIRSYGPEAGTRSHGWKEVTRPS